MEYYVLDKDFNIINILQGYSSLAWVERFSEPSSIEIDTQYIDGIFDYIKLNNYIKATDSNKIMIIEGITISTYRNEDGITIKVLGRSLESILSRRIVWKQTILEGNFQDSIQKILNENLISPSDEKRKISNFVFKKNENTKITSLTHEKPVQLFGEDLLEIIKSFCSDKDIGFKVELDSNNNFVFELDPGVDRSYNQNENVYVVFSQAMGNLTSSDYAENNDTYKNVALITGEGYGSNTITTTIGDYSGLERREIKISATNVSRTTESGELSLDKYKEQLEEEGKKELNEYEKISAFDGDIDEGTNYIYGKDYFIGDIVQIANNYQKQERVKLIEMSKVIDSSGIDLTPTFVVVEEDN